MIHAIGSLCLRVKEMSRTVRGFARGNIDKRNILVFLFKNVDL